MSFDRHSHTITIKQDGDFLADSGSLFLAVLRDLVHEPGAAQVQKNDWNTIVRYLGCEGRDLSDADYEKFGLAFRSFLAAGRSPSTATEGLFKSFAGMARRESWPVVPVPSELAAVFKRMMASDREIQEKNVSDVLRSRQALASSATLQRQSACASLTRAPGARASVELSWIPFVVSIAMLLAASGADWPSGFYQLLRLFVTGTAAYGVYGTLAQRKFLPWVMGAIAILFNPLLPVEFSQQDWQVIDFWVAVAFAVLLVQTRRRR